MCELLAGRSIEDVAGGRRAPVWGRCSVRHREERVRESRSGRLSIQRLLCAWFVDVAIVSGLRWQCRAEFVSQGRPGSAIAASQTIRRLDIR